MGIILNILILLCMVSLVVAEGTTFRIINARLALCRGDMYSFYINVEDSPIVLGFFDKSCGLVRKYYKTSDAFSTSYKDESIWGKASNLCKPTKFTSGEGWSLLLDNLNIKRKNKLCRLELDYVCIRTNNSKMRIDPSTVTKKDLRKIIFDIDDDAHKVINCVEE